MPLESREALASLQDIAEVEKRTREALVYSGSSAIFILWGVLVACGYAASTWRPEAARTIWLTVSAVGCAATALIVASRLLLVPSNQENRHEDPEENTAARSSHAPHPRCSET